MAAEHKGGKLGGTSQQKTIKEVLAKIKNKKNSPEDTTELAVKPERGEARKMLIRWCLRSQVKGKRTEKH